jgi:predicted regulator of Ras-like GTPase activity (Roadblock/LC7/MglB family)
MSTDILSPNAANFNWLMANFVDNTAAVEQAVVVSSDGMLMAAANVHRGAADRLSAIVTGVRSLAEGASALLRTGAVRNVIVEMRDAYLLVAAIGGISSLGVVCSKTADLGQVGYEMALLADRVGVQLTPDLITELKRAFA